MADSTGYTIKTDEECMDLLGAYALDALLPAEKAAVAAYLPGSPACQAELRELRRAVNALSVSVDERDPSPDLRNRLWNAIQAERAPATVSPAATPGAQAPTPIRQVSTTPATADPTPIRTIPIWGRLAAAVALFLAGAGIAWGVLSGGDDDDAAVVLGQFAITDTADPGSTTSGDVSYDADQNLMRLDLHNLPELQEGYVYQLWIVTDAGDVLPSVVFGKDAGDVTSVAMVANPSGVDALALTREPGPIGSLSATTPIFAVAPLDTSGVEAS
jgi:hypothetical protein